MGTFTDDDLHHLLAEAGGSYAVPPFGADVVLDASRDDADVVPLVRRRWVQLASAAAVVAVGTVLGVGLFGGDGVDRVGQLAGAAPKASAPVQEQVLDSYSPNAGRGDRLERSGADYGDRDLQFQAESGRMPVAAGQGAALRGGKAAAPAAPGAPAAPATPADGARVVKKGSIALVVEDDRVTPTLTQVQGFAAAAGGVVASQRSEESGEAPSGAVVLQVPVSSFERVVAQVRGVQGEVRSATTSGQDVTAQYADLEAQLRTLTAARERFLRILAGADTIGDVLAVQQRVDDVTGRIDRLEGQRRVLAAQSDTATLEVTVTEADDPALRTAEPDTGLSKAFRDAGTGFTTGVEALVRLSGRGLLLALLGGLAYVALRVAWRRARRALV